MMSVTRNTLALLISSVAQKAIAFVYFALIARWAGVERTGVYFFAVSWTLIFSVFTDLGLTSVLIRESAREHEKAERYVSQVLSMKLPMMGAAAVLAILGVKLLGHPPETQLMVALGAVVLMLDAVSLTFYGLLRGHQQLKYEGLGLVVGQSITLVVGVTVLKLGLPLPFLMGALILGSLYNAVVSYWVVRARLRIRPRLMWDKAFVKELVKKAFPFALAGGFVKIYTSADVVLLTTFAGTVAAGIYSVPYKLTYAFQFIPMAFTAALYPAMSRAYATDKTRLGQLLFKGLWYLSLIVAPVVAGMIALAAPLVHLVYGPAYAAAVLPLQMLIPTLIFIFLDFPVGSLLNGTDRQTTQTTIMGVSTVISVLLNLVLIPMFGIMGAVVAALCSHGVLFVSGLAAANKFLEWPFARMLGLWLRIGVSAAGMGLAVAAAAGHLPLVGALALGILLYPLLILLTRAFRVSDIKELMSIVLRRAV